MIGWTCLEEEVGASVAADTPVAAASAAASVVALRDTSRNQDAAKSVPQQYRR